jgi:hypothetical protein
VQASQLDARDASRRQAWGWGGKAQLTSRGRQSQPWVSIQQSLQPAASARDEIEMPKAIPSLRSILCPHSKLWCLVQEAQLKLVVSSAAVAQCQVGNAICRGKGKRGEGKGGGGIWERDSREGGVLRMG